MAVESVERQSELSLLKVLFTRTKRLNSATGFFSIALERQSVKLYVPSSHSHTMIDVTMIKNRSLSHFFSFLQRE